MSPAAHKQSLHGHGSTSNRVAKKTKHTGHNTQYIRGTMNLRKQASSVPAVAGGINNPTQSSVDQTKNVKQFVHGSRPSHLHRDPDTGERWECNSPYCTDIESRHPDNGGPVPIVPGYEPWHGRG